MILTVLKTLWSCIWVLLKPCLFVLIPFSIVFGIAFYVAYLRKKKSGTAHREVIAHFNPKNDVSIFTKLFVQLPRQFWENYYNIKVGEFRKHGIIMYCGKQGMGKTLTMTHDILQLKYQYPSLKVGTNYGLNGEDFVIGVSLLMLTMAKRVCFVLLMSVRIGLVVQCQRISHREC